MSAFIFVQAQITDPVKFAGYAQVVPTLVEKFGGTYRILGGDVDCLEGEWDSAAVVMSEWPSKAAAEAFWQSPEYQEARVLREGTGSFQVLLIADKATTPLT